MGEYADYMLNGDDCQFCGEYLGNGEGFPRSCAACADDEAMTTHRPPPGKNKADCPQCGKRVKKKGLAQHIADAHKPPSKTPTLDALVDHIFAMKRTTGYPPLAMTLHRSVMNRVKDEMRHASGLVTISPTADGPNIEIAGIPVTDGVGQ